MELITSLIRVKDLESYIESDAFRKSQVIPISPHRARSHARNPYAEPDDLALVVIHIEGQIQAYLGILPDIIYPSGQPEKAGWLSCMWVNPQLRGKGIAKQLINTVFEHWEHRILVTEFTPEAKGLYDRTQQFNDLHKPEGVRGYLRPDFARLLAAKSKTWQNLKPLLHVADSLLKPLNWLRLQLYQPAVPHFSVINEIDEETAVFIGRFLEKQLMRRDAAGLTWLLKNPWVIPSPGPDDISNRYHFTATAGRFDYFAVKIRNSEREMTGFLIMSLRDGHLKVPYCFTTGENVKDMLTVICHHAVQTGATMVSVFHPALTAMIKSGGSSPFFLKRTVRRHYIISKKFEVTQPVDIHDGDADAGFT